MYTFLKRLIDLTLTIGTLLVFSPFMVVISIIIKLENKGPVIFKYTRVGKDGKEFQTFKFRSMVMSEPTLTRIGAFLRATSLDEMPQLFNVIKGDLSLVGPNALLPFEIERLSESEREILKCTPGITGNWQVYGKSFDWEERIKLDLEYVRRRSIWFDLWLLLYTIPTVLKYSRYTERPEKNSPPEA